eukprot:76087-Rhodomonas_salina.2
MVPFLQLGLGHTRGQRQVDRTSGLLRLQPDPISLSRAVRPRLLTMNALATYAHTFTTPVVAGSSSSYAGTRVCIFGYDQALAEIGRRSPRLGESRSRVPGPGYTRVPGYRVPGDT